jgi:hypothetical protein
MFGLKTQLPMVTADDAVLAIRHAVQEHGDEHYRLGEPASIENVCWFGSLLGWTWPASYLAVLRKHNGVWVKGAMILSFLESIDIFLIFHETWHKPNGFCPVASDGCGNYFVLSIGELGAMGECPVVFLEYGTENIGIVGRTYAEFVVNHLAHECADAGCKSPIERTAFKSPLDD